MEKTYRMNSTYHLCTAIHKRVLPRTKNRGVCIIVHGGGWWGGRAQDTDDVGLDSMALNRGLDVISVEYTKAGSQPHWWNTKSTLPTHGGGPGAATIALGQVREWIRAAQSAYGADRTMLIGGSAGGHLALAAAATMRVNRILAISPPLRFGTDWSQKKRVAIRNESGRCSWENAFDITYDGTQRTLDALNSKQPGSPISPEFIFIGTGDEVVSADAVTMRAVTYSQTRKVEYDTTSHGWPLLGQCWAAVGSHMDIVARGE